MIYLDYAATTPLAPEVAETMSAWLRHDAGFANPASSHAPGVEAAAAVEHARAQVAQLLNAEPESLVWTSGATEANNLAIKGAARSYRKRGQHILVSPIEHPSVLAACEALAVEGFEIEELPIDGQGRVTPDALRAALREDTVLVTLGHVNNEIGTVQDLETLGPLVAEHGAILHVDAVQSCGRLAVDVQRWRAHLVTVSAHKVYGPKGVGALYVKSRPRVRLRPLLHGGGQEQGLRPGTVPTHQVVGMGAAFELANRRRAADAAVARALTERLWAGLERLEGVLRNGSGDGAPHILNVSVIGVQGEALRAALPDLAVSSGSACSAGSAASPVLRALGRPDQLAHASLRFSVGRFNREQDIDRAVERVATEIRRLRAISPIWEAYQQGEPVVTLYTV